MSGVYIDNKRKISVEKGTDDGARRILDELKGIRFGGVGIVIHEGCVVQIERTERSRLGKIILTFLGEVQGQTNEPDAAATSVQAASVGAANAVTNPEDAVQKAGSELTEKLVSRIGSGAYSPLDASTLKAPATVTHQDENVLLLGLKSPFSTA